MQSKSKQVQSMESTLCVACTHIQGPSQVMRLSTGFPRKVPPLSTKPEAPCPHCTTHPLEDMRSGGAAQHSTVLCTGQHEATAQHHTKYCTAHHRVTAQHHTKYCTAHHKATAQHCTKYCTAQHSTALCSAEFACHQCHQCHQCLHFYARNKQ
jgi:hypothetical protein